MDKRVLAALRNIDTKRFRQLWEKAKTNDLKGVSKEESRIIKIMMDHETEYFKEFESSKNGDRQENRHGHFPTLKTYSQIFDFFANFSRVLVKLNLTSR